MDILDTLLTLNNLIFCLFLALIVWIGRRLVEYIWKNSKTNKVWNELALPMSPILLGAIIAPLVRMYPFPADFSSTSGRVLFGTVLGFISAHVFKIVKGMLKQKEKEAGDALSSDDENL